MVEENKNPQDTTRDIPPPLDDFTTTRATNDAGSNMPPKRNPTWVSGDQNPFTPIIRKVMPFVTDVYQDFKKNTAPLPPPSAPTSGSGDTNWTGNLQMVEPYEKKSTLGGGSRPTIPPKPTTPVTKAEAFPGLITSVDDKGNTSYSYQGLPPDASEIERTRAASREGAAKWDARVAQEEAESKSKLRAREFASQYKHTTFADFQEKLGGVQRNALGVDNQLVLFNTIAKQEEAWNKELRALEIAEVQYGPNSVEALKARVKMMEDSKKFGLDERKVKVDEQKGEVDKAKGVMDMAHTQAQITQILENMTTGKVDREKTIAEIQGIHQKTIGTKYETVTKAAQLLLEAAANNIDRAAGSLQAKQALEQTQAGFAGIDYIDRLRKSNPGATFNDLPPVIRVGERYEIRPGAYVMWDGKKFVDASAAITGSAPIYANRYAQQGK